MSIWRAIMGINSRIQKAAVGQQGHLLWWLVIHHHQFLLDHTCAFFLPLVSSSSWVKSHTAHLLITWFLIPHGPDFSPQYVYIMLWFNIWYTCVLDYGTNFSCKNLNCCPPMPSDLMNLGRDDVMIHKGFSESDRVRCEWSNREHCWPLSLLFWGAGT